LNSIIKVLVTQFFKLNQGRYGNTIQDVLVVDFNAQDQRS
jgi:hypothetical protein